MSDDAFRLLYLRHGETELNRGQRMQGITAEPLNATGRAQVARAAARLAGEKIDVVYTSELTRAVETTDLAVGRRGLSVRLEPRLREQDLGVWEGERWLELCSLYSPEDVARFKSDFEYAPPGGETKRKLHERVTGFFEEMPAKHPGETVLAVSHGGPLLVIMYHVLGIPYGTENRFYGTNGGLTEFTRRDGAWHLVTFNEIHHLRSGR